MLIYLQVHLYYLLPPIAVLLALCSPLLGRRDGIKVLWLCFMATVWTTPWDNYIISQSTWGYPAGSIVGKIFLVPIEEQLFFILQPILLILLHSVITHSRLVPFSISRITLPRRAKSTLISRQDRHVSSKVNTLPRRPIAAIFWAGVFILGTVLINEANGSRLLVDIISRDFGRQTFYLGWILVWTSPVIGLLSWLGASMITPDWIAWALGSAWLCVVDTIAIRAGAWKISRDTSLGIEVVHGLPIEEFVFFLLTSYLIILASPLISHLHTLMILHPAYPPCPPLNPITHIKRLAQMVIVDKGLEIDGDVLDGLTDAEETLRKGSKSFQVATLAFGREMRIPLVAIYAWCRVTDNLMDDPIASSPDDQGSDNPHKTKNDILSVIREHLFMSYRRPGGGGVSRSHMDSILDGIPNLSPSSRSAFHLFTALVPRLVPIGPFLELCMGYETDMAFVDPPQKGNGSTMTATATAVRSGLRRKMRDGTFDPERHLPIKTMHDLLGYADDVAGSIASAICYLSWSVLTDTSDEHATKPVLSHAWSQVNDVGIRKSWMDLPDGRKQFLTTRRLWIVQKSREMGRALQLVNIARDISKDALIGRLYIPISWFLKPSSLTSILFPDPTSPPGYAPYTLPLLDVADELRRASVLAIEHLPRTARGGTRAMVASYFEIALAIKRNNGEVDERGIKVSKGRRLWAAAHAFYKS